MLPRFPGFSKTFHRSGLAGSNGRCCFSVKKGNCVKPTIMDDRIGLVPSPQVNENSGLGLGLVYWGAASKNSGGRDDAK